MSKAECRRVYGYVLECETKNGTVTREGFAECDGTYNRATILAITEALKRFQKPCEITIHAENTWVLNMIETRLEGWERSGYRNTKGEPIKMQQEWEELGKQAKGHTINTAQGKHAYSTWIREESRKKNV